MQFHPASNLFPLMSGSEFSKLVADIQKNGLMERITIHEDMILDGRNRYRACVEAGIQPLYIQWDGTGGSPTIFSVSKNLNRRHLTIGQQAAVAVEMLPLLREEARKRQATHKNGNHYEKQLMPKTEQAVSGPINTIAAKATGVGKTIVARAKAIKEKDASAFERIRTGESKVESEYRRVFNGVEPLPGGQRRPQVFSADSKKGKLNRAAHNKRFTDMLWTVEAGVLGLEQFCLKTICENAEPVDLKRIRKSIAAIASKSRNIRQALEGVMRDNLQSDSDADDRSEGFESSSICAADTASIEAQEN